MVVQGKPEKEDMATEMNWITQLMVPSSYNSKHMYLKVTCAESEVHINNVVELKST